MSAMMEVSRPRDYYESGSSEEISQQDIDKIQTLWSDIKDVIIFFKEIIYVKI